MQTLHEASFEIARQLVEIAQAEGRLPRVVGIHSIENFGDGEASVWLELDDAAANEGTGIVWCHVDERAVVGIDRADILRTLTGYGHAVH